MDETEKREDAPTVDEDEVSYSKFPSAASFFVCLFVSGGVDDLPVLILSSRESVCSS